MVLISLGSNQGDSVAVLNAATDALRVRAAADFRSSALYCTSPVDCPPGSPDFVNAAVAFVARADDSPEAMLAFLKALERTHGRGQSMVRNAPRVLDLDLILYDQQVRDTDSFVLPHPRAALRRFVMAPAASIAPELVWPIGGATVGEMHAALHTAEVVQPLA